MTNGTWPIAEKLANTERHLDVAKGHSARADDNTDELKKLNRSIFRPVVGFNKEAKRAAQEAKVQARYDEERDAREKTMMDIRESKNRLGRAATYGRSGDDEEEGILGGDGVDVRNKYKTAQRKEQRKRYQFDATASDDELEDELDNNLEEIGDVTKRLKALGMAMGEELDKQNARIEVIDGKTVGVEERLRLNTHRVSAGFVLAVRSIHSSTRSSRRSNRQSVLVVVSNLNLESIWICLQFFTNHSSQSTSMDRLEALGATLSQITLYDIKSAYNQVYTSPPFPAT